MIARLFAIFTSARLIEAGYYRRIESMRYHYTCQAYRVSRRFECDTKQAGMFLTIWRSWNVSLIASLWQEIPMSHRRD